MPHASSFLRSLVAQGGGASHLCLGVLLYALPFLMAACVVEESPSARNNRPLFAPSTTNTPPANIPTGSVAARDPSTQTTASRVQAVLQPLGGITYDAQVLPIISPDGLKLAVEEGVAPDWPTLLALPDAAPSPGTRVALYDISTSPPKRIDLAENVPAGLLLGRSADHVGVLVEYPRDDGSRWIGKLRWASGAIEWLVKSPPGVINAHAILTSAGDLAFTRTTVASPMRDLVLLRPDGVEITRAAGSGGAGSYEFPLATDDPGLLFALARVADALEIEAIRLAPDPASATKVRLGSTITRRLLAGEVSDSTAYQIAASVASPLPAPPRTSDAIVNTPLPIAMLHPVLGRMVIYDLQRNSLVPLAADSYAAIPYATIPANRNETADGYFCATAQGLAFEPVPAATPNSSLTTVRVVAGAVMPRRAIGSQPVASTTKSGGAAPPRSIIAFSPSRADPQRLEITAITLGTQGKDPLAP